MSQSNLAKKNFRFARKNLGERNFLRPNRRPSSKPPFWILTFLKNGLRFPNLHEKVGSKKSADWAFYRAKFFFQISPYLEILNFEIFENFSKFKNAVTSPFMDRFYSNSTCRSFWKIKSHLQYSIDALRPLFISHTFLYIIKKRSCKILIFFFCQISPKTDFVFQTYMKK